MEGSVYTIAPRFIMPIGSVDMPKNIVRQFWLTVQDTGERSRGSTRER